MVASLLFSSEILAFFFAKSKSWIGDLNYSDLFTGHNFSNKLINFIIKSHVMFFGCCAPIRPTMLKALQVQLKSL